MRLDDVPPHTLPSTPTPTHLPAYCLLHSIRKWPHPSPSLSLLFALNFKRLKRLVPPESLIKLMEYFHAYVYLSSVPPPPPAPSTRHAVRCHGTSLFRGYYELPRHLATPRIVSHRFTARHQLIPFWKWHFARKTGLINRIIAPLANVFIFFCSLFSLFLTRLLSFPFFELSFMIFHFCLSLTFSMVAFRLLFSKVNNTSQLFHSRYRFIALSFYVFF